ncbi:MAG: hypothetical protein Q7U16_13005 [Agitococcus sp.]|nr:hypothetical protein [Agitococcus sp.]
MNLPSFAGDAVATESRMHWVHVPFAFVEALYDAQILKVQRNHVRRARNSKHILEVDSPIHLNYLAGRTADGKVRLIDGYTRITAIKNADKARPEKVWLGLVDCRSNAELEKLYDAIDSRQAVKRGRDAFEEGLRRAGLLTKIKSPLFVKGQAVSAVVAASGTSDIRKGTWDLRQGIAVLDPLNLGGDGPKLPAGALAALLLIAANEPDSEAVQKFAIALMHPEAVPRGTKAQQSGALSCAKELAIRREQGSLSGKNVAVIMETVLSAWHRQAKGLRADQASMLSRQDFLKTIS